MTQLRIGVKKKIKHVGINLTTDKLLWRKDPY